MIAPRRGVAALFALFALLVGGAAPAAEPPAAPPPAGAGAAADEAVVSLWAFVSPGMSEKRGCRIRVVIENRTTGRFGFYGKFRALLKEEERDAWFVSAAAIPPKATAERLYSCVLLPDTIELDVHSDLGYPRTCEVDGESSSPCPVRVRFVSNVKLVGPELSGRY